MNGGRAVRGNSVGPATLDEINIASGWTLKLRRIILSAALVDILH